MLTLRVPPLRERPEDIPELVGSFLAGQQEQRPVADETMALLKRYMWPGNVRELRNCVEYMVHVADGAVFQPADLPPKVLVGTSAEAPAVPLPVSQPEEERELAFLLSALSASPLSARRGRRTLARESGALGIPMTEAHIRLRLEQMADRGLVMLRHGAAPVVTEAGAELLTRLTGRQLGEKWVNWATTGRV